METGDSSHGGGGGGCLASLRCIGQPGGRGRCAVIEDALRFMLDDPLLSQTTKNLRHDLAALLRQGDLALRSALRDVAGRRRHRLAAEAGLPRATAADLIAANAARLLRPCEPRRMRGDRGSDVRGRFRTAPVSRVCHRTRLRLTTARAAEQLPGVTLCVLVDGRRDADAFAHLVESLFAAGVRMIQIRDKTLLRPRCRSRAAGLADRPRVRHHHHGRHAATW